MKEKYGIARYKRGFEITSINDQVVQFMAKVMSIKLLQKKRMNQCTTRVIDVAKKCYVNV